MEHSLVGIDPGTFGAVAVLHGDGLSSLSVWQLPILKLKIGTKSRSRLDLDACWSLFLAIGAAFEPRMAFIEDVNGYSGNAQSTGAAGFTFGSTAGALEMGLVAAEIPRDKVTPAVWKKALGIKGKGREGKDASRLKATQLFPKYADLFRRSSDDGVAEAVLIASYGVQKLRST